MHFFIGWALEQKGDVPTALNAFERAVSLDKTPAAIAFLGHGHALAGNRAEAERAKTAGGSARSEADQARSELAQAKQAAAAAQQAAESAKATAAQAHQQLAVAQQTAQQKQHDVEQAKAAVAKAEAELGRIRAELTASVEKAQAEAKHRQAEAGEQLAVLEVDLLDGVDEQGEHAGAIVAMRGGAAVEGAKKGALAAIIRSVGTDDHRNPHTGGLRYANGVSAIPALALSNPDADQLSRAMARAKTPVRLKIVLETAIDENAESGNVIAEIPGQTDEIVLVSGHLDSWDPGTGAIDDASGVAIAAAAAKLVGDLKGKPARR